MDESKTAAIGRDHQFYVAISKYLFIHDEYGVVEVRDPIRLDEARTYGLSPLILYGLTVAGLPIRWSTYSALKEPRDLAEVLNEGWSLAPGLKGLPDRLHVSRHLFEAAPSLENLSKFGISLVVADNKEKSLPAAMRATQDAAHSLGWRLQRVSGGNNTLNDLIVAALEDHQRDERYPPWQHKPLAMQAKGRAWSALEPRNMNLDRSMQIDWTSGKWLHSWEATVPPSIERMFHIRADGVGARSLVSSRLYAVMNEGDDSDSNGAFDSADYIDDFRDNRAELLKDMLLNWPNSAADVAKDAGITAKELKWLTSGKKLFDDLPNHSLTDILSIAYDEYVGEYNIQGPCVLIANHGTALERTYITFTHGGDAEPCEVVPSSGPADPSWRYFIVNGCGMRLCVVMAPRGERITGRMGNLLFNFSGVVAIPTDIYHDFVASCGRACRSPSANSPEMEDLEERHETFLRILENHKCDSWKMASIGCKFIYDE